MNSISINNFKSLVDLEVRLGALTVFSGLNGSGKSSVLQVLAMLKQSQYNIKHKNIGDGVKLKLKGEYVNLGRIQDVYSESANSKHIDIEISINNKKTKLSSDINQKEKDYLFCDISDDDCFQLTSILDGFQFIQADRIVPCVEYDQASSEDRDVNNLGVRGEYSVDFLANNSNDKISPNRLFTKDAIGVTRELFTQTAPTDSLLDQVCGWLQHISPGVKISTDEIIGTDSVKLQYNYTGESITSETDFRRPTHVGFGLTYCLPIILAALIAKKNSFLILENPEAHLHPQGQFAMGTLLAKCANDGVNVLVETHSDHVLNGIRVAVKQSIISHENVAIHYFSRGVENGITFVQSPNVLHDGSMSNWPEGFFDQWSKSLDVLLG
ncbi:DUF3696 domain-containing protein [Hafnia paralvei]|uniref:DUF3696 domain-containing protein n=1 Tax=Hafnia paralvei TaxID=546367 RepID=UPI003CF1CFC9